MKFEYEGSEGRVGPIALIANGGTLYVKTDFGCVAFYGGDVTPIHFDNFDLWFEYLADNDRAFYPGDKITITF